MALSYPGEMNCVCVDTSLDTHLLVLLHDRETISKFREKLCKEHHQCFPELGEINISAVKVKRKNALGLFLDYHLPDSVCLSMAFKGIGRSCWFVFVEASKRIVEDKAELLSLMDADKNCSKEFETNSLLLDGYTKNHNPEVAEKMTKKRKLELVLLDEEKSPKKPNVDLSQSAADVDESHGDVLVNVVASQTETLPESIGKEIDKSVEDVGVENDNLVSHTEIHLDTDSGLTTRPKTERKDDTNHSSAAAAITAVEHVDDAMRGENLDDPFPEASQKENEMDESSVNVVGREQIETDNLAANDLDSGLTTRPDIEKKKRPEDNISQPCDVTLTTSVEKSVVVAATTTSRFDADELREDGLVEIVPATESSPTEKLDESLTEATRKETGKSVEDVGRDELETDNLVSHQENHFDTSSGLATRTDAAMEKTPLINNTKDTNAPLEKCSEMADSPEDNRLVEKDDMGDNLVVADSDEDNRLSKKSLIEKADIGDNLVIADSADEVDGGAKSIKEKKRLDIHPSRSVYDGSFSLMRRKEKKGRVQQSASSASSRLKSRVKNVRSEPVKAAAVKSKKQDVKKISTKPVTMNMKKTNFFQDAEKSNSSEDEYKMTSDFSTARTPSDYSSEDDSDVNSMSRKQGNNLVGGTNKFSGSLQDILRRSRTYKKALINAQSQPDIDHDSPIGCP